MLLQAMIATFALVLVVVTTTKAEIVRHFHNDNPNLQVDNLITTSRAGGVSRSMIMNSGEANNVENTVQSSRSTTRHRHRRRHLTSTTETSTTSGVANNDKMRNNEQVVEEIIELFPLRFDITVPVADSDDYEGDNNSDSSETKTVFQWPYVSSVITNTPTTHVPTMSVSPTKTMTAGPSTVPPTQTPTQTPTTHNPTTKHPTSSNPTTNHPTSSQPTTLRPTTLTPTTKQPSISPSIFISDEPTPKPYCAPVYDISGGTTNYVAGDRVTINNYIYECRDKVHEPYCNIVEDGTNVVTAFTYEEKKLWLEAWVKKSKCIVRTQTPSDSPSDIPSDLPSNVPSSTVSSIPSIMQSSMPSIEPTNDPTTFPTSDSPTLSPSTEPTSGSPTNSPTSDSPTLSPSTEPTSDSPTSMPTQPPTKVLICPLPYSQYKTDYKAGDYVEIDGNVFECAGGPYSDDNDDDVSKSKYVPYCNVADKTLLAPVEVVWWNVAWTLVGGPCIRPSAVPTVVTTSQQPSVINSFEPSGVQSSLPSSAPSIGMTVMPSKQKSNMPSLSFQPSFILSTEPSMPPPSIEPTTAHPITNSPTPIVHCPPAYSQYKTDYVAGDLVEIYSNVFQCAGGKTENEAVLYVPYCNIADAYLLDNTDELELWNQAWTHVGGPCYKTESPTKVPTFSIPTGNPTYKVSATPSTLPSGKPTSEIPSSSPSIQSSVLPSHTPTTIRPTNSPTYIPSSVSPSVRQSMAPVTQPTATPVDLTSTAPSSEDTMLSNSTVVAATPTQAVAATTTASINTTCPDSYDPSIVLSYKAGTEVEHEQVAYRCNSVASWAYYCKSTYFRPQLNNPNLTLWKNAWLEIGPCVLAPTVSPYPTNQPTTKPSTSPPSTSPSTSHPTTAHPITLPPSTLKPIDTSERFSNTLIPTTRPTTLVPTTAMPTTAKPTTMPPIIIVEEISMTLLPTLVPTEESPVVSTSIPTMMNDDDDKYRYVTTIQEEEATNNNFPYPYPYIRYTQWYMLDSDIKTIASTIGYDRTSWDNLQLSELEDVRYIDLTATEQDAITTSLGLSSDMWDCYMNHYTGYYWDDLQTIGVDVYYEILGYNAMSWDYESEYVETEDMSWSELSITQQDAANMLCFFENSWDWISLMDW